MHGVINPGSRVIQWMPGLPSLEDMQGIVGGLVTTVSLAQTGPARELTLWVNDEGLIYQLPVAAHVPATHENLVGPIIITASDLSTGELAEITEEEINGLRFAVESLIDFGAGGLVPVLEWVGSPATV